MITASIITYKHSHEEIKRVIDCALGSVIETLYIIDHSPNNQLSVLKNYSSKIQYIRHENKGYGSGHNIAIREAIRLNVVYHAVINPDIHFENGLLNQLADFMEAHPDVGLMMPKVFYPDGRLQYLCKLLPTPWDLIVHRFLPAKYLKKNLEHFTLAFTGYDHIMNVPYLSGCFMFFRISALKEIGLFDERFFMYAEDINISRRMHEKYKTLFFPDVSITHIHEAASHKSFRMFIVHIKSLVKYFNKWGWFFDETRRKTNRKVLQELHK